MRLPNEPASSGTATSPSQPASKPRAAGGSRWNSSADPFAGLTRGTTAGEAQGQGPYPGVPGYSAMDNWTRSQATGTYSAPDYVSQLLEKAGYATPVTEGTGRQSVGGLNLKAAEDLTPYGYSVSEDDARNILESYAPEAKGDPAELSKQRVETEARAVPMTRAAYDKLSDDQRAAVDFNAALIAAREKDLNSGWMLRVNPEGTPFVDNRRAMFGDDAPTGGLPSHTLALLEKIGYKAPGTRIEDFLSLDMAISAEELKDLKLPEGISFVTETPKQKPASSRAMPYGRNAGPWVSAQQAEPVQDNYAQIHSAENRGMIQLDVIRRASETLANARRGLGHPTWNPSLSATNALGVTDLPEAVPLGWGTTNSFSSPKDRAKNSDFQQIFEILQTDASKTKLADSPSFWAGLKKAGASEKDIDELFQFIDQRTRWMLKNDMTPAEGQNDAMTIRELAGLGPAHD